MGEGGEEGGEDEVFFHFKNFVMHSNYFKSIVGWRSTAVGQVRKSPGSLTTSVYKIIRLLYSYLYTLRAGQHNIQLGMLASLVDSTSILHEQSSLLYATRDLISVCTFLRIACVNVQLQMNNAKFYSL